MKNVAFEILMLCGLGSSWSCLWFLVFRLQSVIQPFALFHQSVFDYMCSIVVFQSGEREDREREREIKRDRERYIDEISTRRF